MELTGRRIVLRDHRAADWVRLAAYQSDERFRAFAPPGTGSPEAARRLCNLFVGWAGESPRRNHQLAVVELSPRRVVGSTGLRAVPRSRPVAADGATRRAAEFGIELSPEVWGRGLALESALLLLPFGFDALKLHEIVATCVTQNARIVRLLEGIGFSRTGTDAGDAWMSTRGFTRTA